jgi:hypothetical protein
MRVIEKLPAVGVIDDTDDKIFGEISPEKLEEEIKSFTRFVQTDDPRQEALWFLSIPKKTRLEIIQKHRPKANR